MKISMKVMMMTLAMVLTVAVAFAQPRGEGQKAEGQRGGDPTERVKQETTRLTDELGLDAKQATKVEAINLKYAKQQQEMRAAMQKQREAGTEVDREAAGGKMKEMRAAQENEIKAVLTPTQIEKFDAMPKPERGGKGKAGEEGKGKTGGKGKVEGKGNPEGGKQDAATRGKQQTQKMTEALELDAKQATKVEAINLKYAKKQEEMRAEMQKEGADKEAMKGKMKTARTAQESEIKAVLTPKQIEKFEAMKVEGKEKAKTKAGGEKGKKGKKN
jgi:hypothetical protein